MKNLYVFAATFIGSLVMAVTAQETLPPEAPAFSLDFPLPGYTAYDAPISAVYDHSGAPYEKDGKILAFSGEAGNCVYGVIRIKAADGSARVYIKNALNLNRDLRTACLALKSGEIVTNSFLYTYPKQDRSQIGVVEGETLFVTSPADTTHLSYDGHVGYDYPLSSTIIAPADGVLCLARKAGKTSGTGAWRNSTQCPYGLDEINTGIRDPWILAHTFYIVHPGSDNLSTWFLHASSLDNEILDEISSNGYANVDRNQVVGTTGGFWKREQEALVTHLHFEVRENGSTLVDPYGWRTSPALWAVGGSSGGGACGGLNASLVIDEIDLASPPGATEIHLNDSTSAATEFHTSNSSTLRATISVVPTVGNGSATRHVWISSCPGGEALDQVVLIGSTPFNPCDLSGNQVHLKVSQEDEPKVSDCKLELDATHYINYATSNCGINDCSVWRAIYPDF